MNVVSNLLTGTDNKRSAPFMQVFASRAPPVGAGGGGTAEDEATEDVVAGVEAGRGATFDVDVDTGAAELLVTGKGETIEVGADTGVLTLVTDAIVVGLVAGAEDTGAAGAAEEDTGTVAEPPEKPFQTAGPGIG
jgi:hypothetical protein